jgi:hypothetical protein
MDPNDRSTSSLNDPMPGTAGADAARGSLRDDSVRATTNASGGAGGADDLRGDANPGDEIGEAWAASRACSPARPSAR